jgi:hypothetical protein
VTLDVARDAVAQKNWDSAIDAFREAQLEIPLAPDDLVLLGDALWWAAQPDEAVGAYEKLSFQPAHLTTSRVSCATAVP